MDEFKKPSAMPMVILVAVAAAFMLFGKTPTQAIKAAKDIVGQQAQPDAGPFVQAGHQQPVEQPQAQAGLIIHGEPIETSFQGKLIRVVDGDTLEILLADNTHPNFRLAGIDAPERGQAYGKKATDIIKPYIGQQVTVHQTGTDRWQRPIAFVVLADGTNVNAAMIDAGLAWHYKAYSDDAELARLEVEARQSGRGLWVDSRAVPPWEWRKK